MSATASVALADDTVKENDCGIFSVLSSEQFAQEFPENHQVSKSMREFFVKGGKGQIFKVNFPADDVSQSAWLQNYFIAIAELPESPQRGGEAIFFHDPRLLRRTRALLAQGLPVLYGFNGAIKGEVHCLDDPLAQKISACFFKNKAPEALILTPSADYYALVHEEKHLSDCRSGIRTEILTALRKGVKSPERRNLVERYLLEQRAYATQLTLIDQEKNGSHKGYLKISMGLDGIRGTDVSEVSLSGYARKELIEVKNSFRQNYEFPLEDLRYQMEGEDRRQLEWLDALIKKYVLPMPASPLESLIQELNFK